MANGQIWDEGYEYGSVLPYRFPINKDGQKAGDTEWNPLYSGLVRGPLNMLGDLISSTGKAMRGGYSQDEMADAGARMGVESMMLGLGMSKPSGSMGIFGGRLAKTADTKKLAEALHMESVGADKEAIWRKTGWFRDQDGRMKFEIPDDKARLKTENLQPGRMSPENVHIPFSWDMTAEQKAKGGLVLNDVLEHPALFEAYPHLAELPVKAMPLGSMLGGTRGAIAEDEVGKTLMYLSGGLPEDILSTGLHETQHGVQRAENFARGGSPEKFLTKEFNDSYKQANEVLKSARGALVTMAPNLNVYRAASGLRAKQRGLTKESINGLWRPELEALEEAERLGPYWEHYIQAEERMKSFEGTKTEAYTSYRHLAGEAESRNVQSRRAGIKENKSGYRDPNNESLRVDRTMPPWMTRDVEDKDLLVEFEPVEHDPFKGAK